MARLKNSRGIQNQQQQAKVHAHKWKAPEAGVLKVNVDASFRSASTNFKVGMVLRNHIGEFLAGRIICLEAAVTIFEEEAIGTREALS